MGPHTGQALHHLLDGSPSGPRSASLVATGRKVRDIPGRPGPGADHSALPRVTFTDPAIGSAGLAEAQARYAFPTFHRGIEDALRDLGT